MYNETLVLPSNYPLMSQSEIKRAPWNEVPIPEKEFEATISQSLSKTVKVHTNEYILNDRVEYSDEGYEYIDSSINTEGINWKKLYTNNDYHTPIELIELFGQFLKEQLEKGIIFKSPAFTSQLIQECIGWTEDETEVQKE